MTAADDLRRMAANNEIPSGPGGSTVQSQINLANANPGLSASQILGMTGGGGGGGGGGTGATPTAGGGNQGSVQQLGGQINSLLGAIASGNKQAFDEAVRQFNLSFGLDQAKFTEGVRQFNQNLAIAQSGLTGTYAMPNAGTFAGQTSDIRSALANTLGNNFDAARFDAMANQIGGRPNAQQANMLIQTASGGRLNGLDDLQGAFAQGTYTPAQQQATFPAAMSAMQLAASLQANPFRQAQVIGQLGNVLGGQPVAGFQAPGQATGQTDFSGMGNMQRLIDDIRGGTGAVNASSTQSVLDAIPTPNKLDSVNFLRSSPLTQNLVLQGMQEKYGLDPKDALAQIQNTLPQFTAPTTTFGGIKR